MKFPYTEHDVANYLHNIYGVRIHLWLIRKLLKEYFRMSYKQGKSRPVSYDKTKILLMKGLFSVNISKIIQKYDVLINIEEVMFFRSTKASRSWSIKRQETKLMNICLTNSTSLIIAITSLIDVFQQIQRVQYQANLLSNFWES